MTQKFFTKKESELNSFQKVLANNPEVLITFHQNPDGDAIGSALGLKFFLENSGIKNITLVSPTFIADYLKWMPGIEDIIIFDEQDTQTAVDNADFIFCLDFSARSRMKDFADQVLNSQAEIIIIDHHEQPEDFANYYYWDQHASSTSELIYQFIEDLGGKNLIDENIATCLYTGILTDTGAFKYSSTTPTTHRVVAHLLEKGANPTEISRMLFDVNPFQKLKFLGYALGEKLTFLPEYRTAYMAVSAEDLKKFDSKNGDTEGLVNYGLTIENAVMSVLFTERDGQIRISFRSVHDFSVADIARGYFEGGGHKNASGGRSNLSLMETIEKFINLLPQFKNELLKQPK